MTLLLLASPGLPSTSGVIVPGAPGVWPGSGIYPGGVLSLLLPGPGTYPRGTTYPGVIPPVPAPLVLAATTAAQDILTAATQAAGGPS